MECGLGWIPTKIFGVSRLKASLSLSKPLTTAEPRRRCSLADEPRRHGVHLGWTRRGSWAQSQGGIVCQVTTSSPPHTEQLLESLPQGAVSVTVGGRQHWKQPEEKQRPPGRRQAATFPQPPHNTCVRRSEGRGAALTFQDGRTARGWGWRWKVFSCRCFEKKQIKKQPVGMRSYKPQKQSKNMFLEFGQMPKSLLFKMWRIIQDKKRSQLEGIFQFFN